MNPELNGLLSAEDESADGLARRRFLKHAAITGLAAAWSAPIIQTIAPEVALATGGHHPRPGTPRPDDTPSGDTPMPDKCDSDSDNSDDESYDYKGNNSRDDSDDSDCDRDTDDNKSESESEDHDHHDSEPDWRHDSSSDHSDD